jgi:hypothetical protein
MREVSTSKLLANLACTFDLRSFSFFECVRMWAFPLIASLGETAFVISSLPGQTAVKHTISQAAINSIFLEGKLPDNWVKRQVLWPEVIGLMAELFLSNPTPPVEQAPPALKIGVLPNGVQSRLGEMKMAQPLSSGPLQAPIAFEPPSPNDTSSWSCYVWRVWTSIDAPQAALDYINRAAQDAQKGLMPFQQHVQSPKLPIPNILNPPSAQVSPYAAALSSYLKAVYGVDAPSCSSGKLPSIGGGLRGSQPVLNVKNGPGSLLASVAGYVLKFGSGV